MVVSWLARSLELHQMGLGRGDQILVGEDLESRPRSTFGGLKFLYEGMRKSATPSGTSRRTSS
jgi:hypothetical protein